MDYRLFTVGTRVVVEYSVVSTLVGKIGTVKHIETPTGPFWITFDDPSLVEYCTCYDLVENRPCRRISGDYLRLLKREKRKSGFGDFIRRIEA